MTKKYDVVATCLFGMEKTVTYELKKLGIKKESISDGRVYFKADASEIARCNICLSTVERVSIVLGKFNAKTFDDLFDNLQKIDYTHYIKRDDAFPITKVRTINSKLSAGSSIQSVAKKSIAEKLLKTYGVPKLKETNDEVPINIFIMKDAAEVLIDTSGKALNKRGYREKSSIAPLRETIASFMVMASPWNYKRELIDFTCGSGTIPIEAAIKGMNMMPGVNRNFKGEEYSFLGKEVWKNERNKALKEEKDVDFKIKASDIDKFSIEIAKENSKIAGVEHLIDFEVLDLENIKPETDDGFIISNLPYGERLEDIDLDILYKKIKKAIRPLKNFSYYFLTTDENIGKKLNIDFQKNRKLYNGRLKTRLYEYLNPRK